MNAKYIVLAAIYMMVVGCSEPPEIGADSAPAQVTAQVPAPATYNYDHSIYRSALACQNLSDRVEYFMVVSDIYNDAEKQSLAESVNANDGGQCVVLPAHTSVFVAGRRSQDKMIEVRINGSDDTYWVSANVVSGDK